MHLPLECVFHFMTSGPELPVRLSGHSMATLGLGQAIIGGAESENQKIGSKTYIKKIYHLECAVGDCVILKVGSELSISRGLFVAIPIPDFLSGCILESKALILFLETSYRNQSKSI